MSKDKNFLVVSGTVTYVKDGEKAFTFFVKAQDGKYGVNTPCVAFSENIARCRKEIFINSRVLVIGKLIGNQYEKDGRKVYELKVMVDEVSKIGAVEEKKEEEERPPWDQ